MAQLAAEAACAVSGVARLQPGLRALAMRYTRRVAARGSAGADHGGVEVRLSPLVPRPGCAGGGVHVRIAVNVVVDGRRPANRVAFDVQRIVAAAVSAALGHPVAEVAVTVCDIQRAPDSPGGAGRATAG